MAEDRFKNTKMVLEEFAINVENQSRINQKRNPIDIDHQLTFGANSFDLTFTGPPYAKFQDQGVKGHMKGSWTPFKPTTQKAPRSPFEYKTGPGTETILDSLVSKPSFRTRRYVFETVNGKRRLKFSEFSPKTPANMNSAAFLIARSIGRFGVEPKMFFSDAVDQYGPQLTSDLGSAWVADQDKFIQGIKDKFLKA